LGERILREFASALSQHCLLWEIIRVSQGKEWEVLKFLVQWGFQWGNVLCPHNGFWKEFGKGMGKRKPKRPTFPNPNPPMFNHNSPPQRPEKC